MQKRRYHTENQTVFPQSDGMRPPAPGVQTTIQEENPMKSQRVRIDDLQAESMDTLTETDVERIRGGATPYILPYIEQDNLHKIAPRLNSDGAFSWDTTSSP
jgi:hypothetical protein